MTAFLFQRGKAGRVERGEAQYRAEVLLGFVLLCPTYLALINYNIVIPVPPNKVRKRPLGKCRNPVST